MTETPDRGTGLEPARKTDHAQGTQLIVASPPMGHSGRFRSRTPIISVHQTGVRPIHLAADKLTGYRQRLQHETTGRRGRKDDPLYKHRHTLLTKTSYLTDRQKQRLEILWATDGEYVALEVTWMFYQDLIHAYGHPKNPRARS